MFFLLSKVLWFFVQPVNLAIFLLLVAFGLRGLGRPKLSGAASFSSVLILALSAWTSLGALMLNPLEERFQRPSLPDRVDGIVVLGGGFEGAINRVRGGYDLNSAGDRLVETAILARRFPDARIVVSGGSGAIMLDGEGDADTAPRMLTALGVAPDRLVLENKSRNTYENAVYSKALVQPQLGGKWLLVTSAFHMPRSMGLFRKSGFDVIAWPVDYRTSGEEGVGLFRDNVVDSIQNTTLAIREWIGLLAYRLSGRTDSVLPAP